MRAGPIVLLLAMMMIAIYHSHAMMRIARRIHAWTIAARLTLATMSLAQRRCIAMPHASTPVVYFRPTVRRALHLTPKLVVKAIALALCQSVLRCRTSGMVTTCCILVLNLHQRAYGTISVVRLIHTTTSMRQTGTRDVESSQRILMNSRSIPLP